MSIGTNVIIVVTVNVAGSAISAIFAATLSVFWRNWIFCASVNVIPVRVAPTIRAFVRFVFVKFAPCKIAFVKSAFDKLLVNTGHKFPSTEEDENYLKGDDIRFYTKSNHFHCFDDFEKYINDSSIRNRVVITLSINMSN